MNAQDKVKTAEPYEVLYSAVLKEQVALLLSKARTPNTAEAVVLRVLERARAESLSNPERVLMQNDACGRGSIFRQKAGRARLFYIGSREKRRVIVLFIGMQRKEGDKNDPYVLLAKLVNAGRFDSDFAELGVTKPNL